MLALRDEITVRLPPDLAKALRRAARGQLSSISVYTRQALHARLVAEGALTDPYSTGERTDT